MAAESAQDFNQLEARAQRLVQEFVAAGAEYIAPSIIQPAGLFLDVVGESLRARTYVFGDPDGRELCLRPDLTVPACRVYLERDPAALSAAKYCYNGPAFRYQPEGAPSVHAREFRQAGIEAFGLADRAAADVEILTALIKALRATGLEHFEVRIGDIGLFQSLLGSLEMPTRWRRRLAQQFWRPEIFRAELKRLVSQPASTAAGIDAQLLEAIDPDQPTSAEHVIARYLEAKGYDLIGTRTISEIASGLVEASADFRAGPLKAETAELIQSFLGVSGAPMEAVKRLEGLAGTAGLPQSSAFGLFRQRLDLLASHGHDVGRMSFAADFGRTFEYYTGFVFDIIAPRLGPRSPVAGGGRYDGLLRAVGAPYDVPAVGASIYTERLMAALRGGA